jgi:4-hydroxybenzoyl-CoA reductase subunit beta
MGTIGGNIMLDTRCMFYNQSHEWRTALGKCLKADGDWCHVIGSAKACVAAQSSDTVPVLVALDARIVLLQADGVEAEVALRDLFTKDGRLDRVHTVPATSLVTHLRIPPRAAGHKSTYRKVRSRDAVDYPQLGIALVIAVDDDGALTQIEACVGAMLPQPKRLTKLDGWIGQHLTDQVITDLSERAFKQVRPQPNIHGSIEWRRHMAKVEFRRALESLRP